MIDCNKDCPRGYTQRFNGYGGFDDVLTCFDCVKGQLQRADIELKEWDESCAADVHEAMGAEIDDLEKELKMQKLLAAGYYQDAEDATKEVLYWYQAAMRGVEKIKELTGHVT